MNLKFDISGKAFGKLRAVSHVGNGRWECLCECGNKVVKVGANLRSGNTSTCGEYPCCKWPKHGMSRSKEWNTWRGMWERCTNPNHQKFYNYGAKKVKVHPAWKDFSVFFRDVGKKPSPKHSLDRFPNKKGNYEPGNVRWATQRQQCRNSAKNVLYTAFGKTMCLTEWAEEVGMSVQTLAWRLNHEKQPIEIALRPVLKRNKPNAK